MVIGSFVSFLFGHSIPNTNTPKKDSSDQNVSGRETSGERNKKGLGCTTEPGVDDPMNLGNPRTLNGEMGKFGLFSFQQWWVIL